MNTTLYLAQLWGPAILAVGIGFLANGNFYKKIYQNIGGEPLAILIFGMSAIVAGIAQILVHNTWETFLAGLISFLGWATLLKGIVLVTAPRFVEKAGIWEVKKKLVPFAGLLTFVVGLYLTWVAYF